MKTSPTNKVFLIFCSNESGFMKRIKKVESGNLEEVNKWGYLFENVNILSHEIDQLIAFVFYAPFWLTPMYLEDWTMAKFVQSESLKSLDQTH